VVGRGRTVKLAVAGVAAWLSVMVAALSTALQLGLSGTSPLEIVVPAMLAVHVFFGLIESVITVAALAFLFATRPELVDSAATAEQGGPGWILAGVATSFALVLLAPLASSDPDGLEAVAERFGFADQSLSPYYELLPDYQVPALDDPVLSTIMAGLVGLVIVAALALLVARTLHRRSPTPAGE
jgi:cobalt/nickel transport system permease protein